MSNQKKSSSDTYQIYIASLSDYNAGILHGKWVDVEGLTADEIQEEINEILRTSPYTKQYGEVAEEWAIHDFELGGIRISEYESLDTIVSIVEALAEHGEAFAIYYNNVDNLEIASNNFEDAYLGEYDSFLDYATESFDELYAHSIPEGLSIYIDYEAYARDLDAEGYFIEDGHVFRPV
ncbi:antirestriction protein ArdA [Phaeodactylibacter sp.]|uniref:antirestriction protein ArdA n=1 Tax=Phaeodactylibacter sp. TaxID=1940289 RepID=UPI0025E89589|nr:antirestriction protein ArdA [Phaeodactylibacter sp.]MCI5091180.1 antirestriction protein ArdA [Phaeodactylibacter sp.]